MLLISVIVPVYNHEKYVVDCLNSVRDSDYKNTELIIIDDGSTDNSCAVVTSWLEANKQFFQRTVFERQANAGVCRTANRLISLARGDIIVPLASDDALLPAGISRRVEFLQDHPHLLAVFADAAMIDVSGTVLCRELEKNLYKGNKKALADPRFIAAELILKWSVPGPVFAAWRGAYDPIQGVGPYDESLLAEDRDFYLRLLSRHALGYIPDEVALYRHAAGSLCHDPEKTISVRKSILKSEEKICSTLCIRERLFMELVMVRNKADILLIQSHGKLAFLLFAKIMRYAVELTYRVHKLMFIIVSWLMPLPEQKIKTGQLSL